MVVPWAVWERWAEAIREHSSSGSLVGTFCGLVERYEHFTRVLAAVEGHDLADVHWSLSVLGLLRIERSLLAASWYAEREREEIFAVAPELGERAQALEAFAREGGESAEITHQRALVLNELIEMHSAGLSAARMESDVEQKTYLAAAQLSMRLHAPQLARSVAVLTAMEGVEWMSAGALRMLSLHPEQPARGARASVWAPSWVAVTTPELCEVAARERRRRAVRLDQARKVPDQDVPPGGRSALVLYAPWSAGLFRVQGSREVKLSLCVEPGGTGAEVGLAALRARLAQWAELIDVDRVSIVLFLPAVERASAVSRRGCAAPGQAFLAARLFAVAPDLEERALCTALAEGLALHGLEEELWGLWES